jgi:asparagine synthase (glutamine-hydrolysing)
MPALALLYDSPTITVLAAPDSPHLLLPRGQGIILGHLFSREAYRAIGEEDGHVLDMPASAFMRAYWGGYLALRTSRDAAEVLRDPSGHIPCYHAEIDDWHVVTSSPSLLVDAGLIDVEIDWTIVAQALAYPDLRPARTALRGVAEIQPGLSARVFPPGLQIECIWSPWAFTETGGEVLDMGEAVALVRQAVGDCVHAWGSEFANPLVEISGGLDSAIVAAGLAQLGRPIEAITFKAVAGDPDETPYAVAVANHLGAALAILATEHRDVDPARSMAADLARPNARAFAQALDQPERALAQTIGADAFFSGGGGDNVFCYLASVAPIVDRWRRQGIGRGLFATANDIALVTETGAREVWYRTVRRILRRTIIEDWSANTSLLAAAATRDLPFPTGHPWLPVPENALPGKRAQVLSLIRVQNHLDGHGRQAFAPIVFPLLSQPVMEACLRIPSWLWCVDGRNRAVARAAYADALPQSVVARQSKGAFDNLCTRILGEHRDMLHEMLINGVLAQEGLLDTGETAKLLARPVLDSVSVMRLLTLVDVEAWTRAWRGRTRPERHPA